MALVLKLGKTYTDKFGVEHTTAYATIDEVINNKRKKMGNVLLSVYASSDAAIAGKQPLEVCSKICENWVDSAEEAHNDYDNYVSVSAVTADDNEFKQAYLFWENETRYVNAGGFIKEDWEADE